MLHWLNVELWGPIWPNLAASAFCSALVYIRLRVEQERRHEELKRHVADVARGESEAK